MKTTPAVVDSNAVTEWLKPSDALTRFVPPKTELSERIQEEEQRLRYGFRVSRLGFLIDADTASEVMRPLPVFPIPNAPPGLQGLVNLRGNVIPVFDLKRALDSQTPKHNDPMLLVLDHADWAAGLHIDGLPQPLRLEQQVSQLPPLPTKLKEYVAAGYAHHGQLWLELNHRAYFQALVADALESDDRANAWS